MKFPYGICDFYKMRREEYWYLDRTEKIPLIEEAGTHLLFLRPRRFGKSLLLSTLEHYYDVARADEFDELFGKLSIGQRPTAKHHQYFILKWDFSVVDPQGDGQELKQNLHRYINNRIQDFAMYYQKYLPLPIQIEPADAIASFMSLLRAVRQTPYRLYLLIDEYDNFANELMMGSRPTDLERYTALLYGEGSLKTVFKAIKAASAGEGVDRVFITGVSPVALSDITSGYNIAKDISLEPEFHDLCGFRESELANALTGIINAHRIPEAQIEEALTMMRTFYNGYCFSYQIAAPIYNPTLSLYFLEQFQKRQQYPRELLDSNLAMDRGKIAYISTLPHGNRIILNAVSEESPLSLERLAHRFGVEDMLNAAKDERFMVSLLYYFGVLTLAGQTTSGKLRFVIPNLVVKKLYIERIGEMLLPDSDRNDSVQTIERFYNHGDIQPICEYIERRYFRVFDNRDYRWANELTLKTVFLTLLFNRHLS